MITIRCDFQRFEPLPPGKLVAEHPGDYVPVRQAIRRALSDDSPLVVVVRSPILAGWLGDLRDYARDMVRWETVNLRRDFAEKFGFEAPSVLDDRALADLGILNLPPPSVAPTDPVSWLLGRCLGPVWEAQMPYADHVIELIAWAMNHSQPVHSTLETLQHGRLMAWATSHSTYGYLATGDLIERGRAVLCWWALRRYPTSFLVEVGLDTAPEADCAGQAGAVITALEVHAEALRRYWGVQAAHLTAEPAMFVQAALEQMSGLSVVELTAIEDYLNKHPAALIHSILDRIRLRFQHLDESRAVLRNLERLTQPPFPTVPEGDWPIERWLSWATDEYMPYFAWIIRAGQSREQQIALSDRFGDWLIRQYSRLPFDRDAPFLAHQQESVRRLVTESPHTAVIWAIVDGLTWWQGQMLLKECADQELYARSTEAWLSALPSVTSVCKRALAMGYLSPLDHRQPVATLLAERLSSPAEPAKVFTEIEALSEHFASDVRPGLYAVLYNGLDTHNHESRRFTGDEDEAALGHLRKLAHHLAKAGRRCQAEGIDVRIVIGSDHGSTLLPDKVTVLHTPTFAEFLDDADDTPMGGPQKVGDVWLTRACSVLQELTASDIETLSSQWYVLSGDVFGLPQTFLVPRGYACVQRRPRGWTHGGATPEETVVPFLQLQLKPLSVIPPIVQMTGFLLPTRASSLTLELTNPNAFPLWNVRVLAWDGQMATSLGKIAAHKTVSATLQAPTATAKGQRQEIEWLATWEVYGQVEQASGTVDVPVRRFQVSQADELFEGMS